MITMFKKMSFSIRIIILPFFTGLVISYVQLFIHYKKYFWDTLGDFFSDFIVSYVFVYFFFLISGVIIMNTGKYFLPSRVTDNTDVEDILFYVCMVLIVLSILTFIWGYGFPFQIERWI